MQRLKMCTTMPGFYSYFYIIHWFQFVMSIYSWVWGHSLDLDRSTRVTPLEKTDSPFLRSCQMSITPQSLVRFYVYLSLSVLGLWLLELAQAFCMLSILPQYLFTHICIYSALSEKQCFFDVINHLLLLQRSFSSSSVKIHLWQRAVI